MRLDSEGITMGARRTTTIAGCLAAALALASFGCSSDSSDGSDGAAKSTTTSASGAAAATQVVASATPPPQVPLLGVLNAGGGTFEDGTLTLTEVDPSGVWFTDRPVREAGTAGLDAFTELFFSREDPPNAALEIAGADESGDVAVVELSDPKVDAEAGTVSFSATLIAPDDAEAIVAHPGLAGYASRNDKTIPASFGANALFFDAGQGGLTPVVNPVNTDDVGALSTQLTDLIQGYNAFIDADRIAIDTYSRDCARTYMNQADQVMVNLYGSSGPAIRKMLADEAANDGVLPDADDELFDTTKQDLDNAATTLEFLQEIQPDLVAGNCPP
jgi:hypothetical protein